MWYKYIMMIIGCALISPDVSGQSAKEIPCNLFRLSEMTFQKNPTIQRQMLQIDRAKASLQSAVSAFDYRMNAGLGYDRNRFNLFQQDVRYNLANKQINTNTLTFGGGLQRTFRSGLTANASIDYSRISDNFPLNAFGEEVGSYLSENYTTTSFSLSQPLMRGSGTKVTTANERASEVEVESNTLNMIYVSSGELLNTILGYWQYLTSYQQLQIYQENEDRVQQVLSVTNDLVEAEKKPAGDLVQVQADLADKERQTLIAGQQLFSARQNLGRYIGLTEEESTFLTAPLNEFPSLESSTYSPDIELSKLIDLAHKNRADLKALVKTRDALLISLDQSRNSLKPQLDLGGFLQYGGNAAGNGVGRFFTPLSQTEGRNVQFGVSLSYLFPLNNNLAQAGMVNNQVAITDQEVILNNQIRNIELNVSIALNNLHNSVLTLNKSGETLAFYQQVYENEQTKFQNGLTTLLNLILFQERLTFAQLEYLNGQHQFAQSIINLRYETGTLVRAGRELTFPTDRSIFYQLPKLN